MEYSLFCQQNGIDATMQIKNLFPFIQPIIDPPEKSKMVREPCAKIVAMRSDEESEPLMLLEWIQGLYWFGALICFNRLTLIPFPTIEFAYKHTRAKAKQINDMCWLDVLDRLCEDMINKQKA